jgi:Domain of Unknown Function (DUF928)
MKYVKMAAWGALGGLILMISSSSVALGNQQGKPSGPVVEPPRQRLAAAANTPVYVPPPRSAPGGRVGGSTRGTGMMPILSALAPDHTGLTAQEQPSLFWYLAGATTYPVELTITEDRAIQPVVETRISPPIQPGIQRVRLADYGVRLALDVPYRWFVSLVVDPNSRSRDNLAGGTIERIALSKGHRAKLNGAGKSNAPSIYAEMGLWYDAFTAISDLIGATPNDPALHQQRTSLLEQVGLREIAEHDMRRGRAR